MGQAWQRVVASGVLESATERCNGAPPDELLEGIRLFNAGHYFECHEVLEGIWRQERGPIRYLYQGILQVGVGFHHWRNANFRGATLLLADGIDKLGYFAPTCLAVDTERLIRDAAGCRDLLATLGPAQFRTFDWSLVPRITVNGSQP